MPVAVSHVYALFLIYLGWGIFYFTDLHQLVLTFQTMWGLSEAPLSNFELTAAVKANLYWLVLALVCCTPIYGRVHQKLNQQLAPSTYRYTVIVQSLLFLVISVLLLVGKTYNPFIYFRF